MFPVHSSDDSVVHGPTHAGKTLQGPISTGVETKGVNSQSARRRGEHDQSGGRLEYFPVLMNINDCI